MERSGFIIMVENKHDGSFNLRFSRGSVSLLIGEREKKTHTHAHTQRETDLKKSFVVVVAARRSPWIW